VPFTQVLSLQIKTEIGQVFDGTIGDTLQYATLNDQEGNDDDDNNNNNDDGSNSDEDEEEGGICYNAGEYGGILWHWQHRKIKFEHKHAVTGWALCVMNDVCEDVHARLKGEHRNAMEMVVKHLHLPPCPNQHPEVLSMTEAQIVNVFWDEFKAVMNCTPPFHEKSHWATLDVAAHLWHENCSLQFTLGFMAYCVTSKLAGFGPAERSSGAVKQRKDGKRHRQ